MADIPALRIKRAYHAARRSDGQRVLVDSLWPRGLSKERLRLHEWCKEAAPSSALRKWFGHDPDRWLEFRQRYEKELHDRPEVIDHLRDLLTQGPVTLVYAAKDEEHNNAVVLKEVLERNER